METRVAVLAIIVREGSSVQTLNDLLHQYGPYIIGRMGVPREEANAIALIVEGTQERISALTGKLGRFESLHVKSAITSFEV